MTSPRLWAFILLCGAVALRLIDPAPVEFMRSKTFDFYQRIHPRTVDQRLVTIVDLDDRSMEELGQWPWPRTILADLVNKISAMHPAVIGFDIVFPEPDRTSPERLLESVIGKDPAIRERLEALPDNDQIFAQAIEGARVVTGMAPSVNTSQSQTVDRPSSSIAILGHNVLDYLTDYPRMLFNLPEFDKAAKGHGVFIVEGELDGIVRRVPMAIQALDAQQVYPTLSIEMVRVAMNASTMLLRGKRDGTLQGVEDMVLKTRLPNGKVFQLTVPLDQAGRFHVFFSKRDEKKYVSAVDVLRGTASPDMFTNKFVILGTSAVGMLDIKATPTENFLPGVEVHANIIENMLTGQMLKRSRNALDLEAWGTLAVGLLLIVLVPMIGARWTLLLLLVLLVTTGVGSFTLYRENLQLYDPVFPGLVALLLYMFLTYMGYTREEAQRRQVRNAFSHYMSPALVERLADDPSRLRLGGEMREMTLMFCDVRGFTTISELFDAEGLTRLINRFLTPMTDVILDRRGTIDKYMGDCIMAFWNAPLDDGEHARNACLSALEMKARLAVLNQILEKEAQEEGRRHIPLNIGIGVNTGIACVGNMGSDQRFDYSVLGDNVNLASRLEGQSKTYGVTSVLGENTARLVPDMAVLELDLIRVKGKTVPVRIFGLLGDETLVAMEDFQTLRHTHAAMLEAYRGMRWAEAQSLIEACRLILPELSLQGLYDLYDGRVAAYLEAAPPDDWDGVYVALTK
ncbi:CHASE2 domain-containing protein [Rhodospirillum sp. A1_3_36]|uniref:CHASE2 domain-containing protein n=1 Tax=Rhodospirillum sp. A1_3_36 TaxID=3391666 RepID=UPI0039A4442C